MQETKDKKQLILDAAETLLHKYGYSKTSLDDIAKEAGLGKGTIYYYFESKEEIFIAVAKDHSDKYFSLIKKSIASKKGFADKFATSLHMPIKLVYEHAPVLLDAIKNIPPHYLPTLDKFRAESKKRMISILNDVIQDGLEEGVITETIPAERLVNIIFDWFLMGDSNIIVQHPEEFIAKAEADYEWIVQLMLYGLIKRKK
jgi:AcrR family transcriptional regulator